MIAHYDLHHDEAAHTVSALLLLWDGTQILDDSLHAGSADLAATLLGITPSRYVLADADANLLDDPEAGDEDDA
jgi:hypothetical protein